MARVVICNECGRTLEPQDRVTVELRSKGYMRPDKVDDLDACADCEQEIRARFLSSPGLDRLTGFRVGHA